MTKTTAASVNMSRNKSRGTALKSRKSSRAHGTSAVYQHTRPQSIMNNKGKNFETAGEILNYPYSCDQAGDKELVILESRLAG
jgi:hypothetical protein